MSGPPCKAALCAGCLESISDVKVREFFNVVVHLTTSGHFDDDQLEHIIDAGDDLQKLIAKHQGRERAIVKRLQENVPDLAIPAID